MSIKKTVHRYYADSLRQILDVVAIGRISIVSILCQPKKIRDKAIRCIFMSSKP